MYDYPHFGVRRNGDIQGQQVVVDGVWKVITIYTYLCYRCDCAFRMEICIIFSSGLSFVELVPVHTS